MLRTLVRLSRRRVYTDVVTVSAKRRRITGYAVVLGLYALVALVTPLLHHDVACHLQSKTHCDACTASSAAGRIESGLVQLGHSGPVELKLPADIQSGNWAERPSSPGRAPPQESSAV